MKKKFEAILVIILVLSNSKGVRADEFYKTYYLDNTIEENISYDEYIIMGNFTEEKILSLILETFFYNSTNNIRYIPDGTRILNVNLQGKDLYINFNSSIEGYGGTHFETNMIRQILHTCFQFEDVETVTFLINGNFKIFPEGNLVFKYSRKDLELMDYNQNLNLRQKLTYID